MASADKPDGTPAVPLLIGPRRATLLGLVTVSLQRYPEPTGSPPPAPRSYGAIPLAPNGENAALAPLAEGEAVWIALELATACDGRTIDVQAEFDCDGTLSGCGEQRPAPIAVWHPPDGSIDRLVKQDGSPQPIVRVSRVAGRPQCQSIGLTISDRIAAEHTCRSAPYRVTIELMSPERFRAETGIDPGPPIDPSDAYDGAQLP